MPVFGRPRPLFCALIVFASFSLVSLPARANSVAVTGTAYGGEDSNGLSLTAGPTTSIFSAAPIGFSFLASGAAGVAMTLSFRVFPWSGPGFADVQIGNQFTDVVAGAGILFTGTFTVPFSAIAKGIFYAHLSMSGQLSAYQDLTLGQGYTTPGPLMANLVFKGTSLAALNLIDLGNGHFVIDFGTFTFKGNGDLTVAPEPGSLLLVATGLVGFGATVRHRHRLRASRY